MSASLVLAPLVGARACARIGSVAHVDHRTRIAEAYRRWGHSVLRRARAILGRDDEAHEVLQEVFVALLADPSQFEGRSALSTWLYSATTHRCLNRLRDSGTRARLLAERVAPALAEGRAPAVDAAADVRDLLATLPLDQATAFVYYHVDEMSHAEIAAVMGCSRRHVGNLLDRGRAQLERRMEAT